MAPFLHISGIMFHQLSHFLLTHYVFCFSLSPIKPPLSSLLSQSALEVEHLSLPPSQDIFLKLSKIVKGQRSYLQASQSASHSFMDVGRSYEISGRRQNILLLEAKAAAGTSAFLVLSLSPNSHWMIQRPEIPEHTLVNVTGKKS